MPDQAANHGRSWSLDDYRVLVESLRRGLAPDETAELLQRSPGAVCARANLLLPDPSAKLAPRDLTSIYEAAQSQVADPEYDWLEQLSESLDERGNVLWDSDLDNSLRVAWHSRAPSLDDLAAEIGTTTSYLVSRFVDLELASSREEVRLRFRSAVRAGQAKRAAPWTLTLFSESGDTKHSSYHVDLPSAAEARDSLLPDSVEDLDVSTKWEWRIAQTALDSGMQIVASKGEFHPAATLSLTYQFVQSQRGKPSFVVLQNSAGSREAPVVMCNACADSGSWNVPMHALSAGQHDGTSEKVRVVYLRCLVGHESSASIPSDDAGEWIRLLPQVQDRKLEPSFDVVTTQRGSPGSVDKSDADIDDHEWDEDDVGLQAADLIFDSTLDYRSKK